MRIRHLLFVNLLILLMASSCSTRKNIVYLNDMKMGENYPIDVKHEAVIHRDDRLGITVSCKKPELAIPFNVSTGSVTVSEDGNIRTGSAPSTREKGYRVDVDGYINFPILGRLYVEGLKVSEAQNLIRRKIIEGDYIKDPTVAIEFLNFKYTVLGAVSRNGTFTVDGDRITLPQRESLGNKNKISLKDILGGEILTRSTFRKQFGLIAVCVFYVILYITNRYQAQQELIEIEELKIELQKQKYYSLTRSGEFTIRSRQSQVEKMLKQTPDSMLVTPKEPPFIIRTNTEEEE